MARFYFFVPRADHFWSFCSFWSLTESFLTILGKVFLEFFTLAQLSFTTNEMELCYYHQKVDMRVASRVEELLKS